MDHSQFINRMLECSLFQNLEFEQMRELLTFAKFQVLKPDEVAVRESDSTDLFFVVESGRLTISLSSAKQNSELFVKEIKPGDLFGEMALLGVEKRTASVKSKTDSRLIVWNAVDCLDHFRKDKEVGYVVMKNLSTILGARVRDMNLLLRNYADTFGPAITRYL